MSVRRPILVIAIAAGCAGCVAPQPQQARIAPLPRTPARAAPYPMTLARDTLESTARQARSCYRAPRVASEGRQIVTTLRVRVAADGTLSDLPEVLSQEGVYDANRPYAGRMAEAAILSVIRCAPYRMPPELVRGAWIEFELTFSPAASA